MVTYVVMSEATHWLNIAVGHALTLALRRMEPNKFRTEYDDRKCGTCKTDFGKT